MKDTVINIRISETLKDDLTLACELERMSISRFGRVALEEKLDALTKKIGEVTTTEYDGDLDLLQTLAFSEFIFWIYEKKRNPEVSEIEEYYVQHLEVIAKMRKHPLFNDYILYEIDKIAVELNKVMSGEIEELSNFTFSVEGNYNSFNYKMFAEFMFAIRYDGANEKILFIE